MDTENKLIIARRERCVGWVKAVKSINFHYKINKSQDVITAQEIYTMTL